MNDTTIINKSDNRSKTRASKQHLSAKLYKVEDNTVFYTVTSSQGDRQYLVKILLLGLTGNKLRSLKAALNGDIKISCSCPAFLFQGYKFITWRAQTGIERETRSPDKTNPNKEGMACKHILVALNQMKSDYQSIYNLFKAQQPKGKDKPQPSDIKDNRKSDSPTEFDIKIITDFKDACTKLYNDYDKFKKDGGEGSFADSDAFDGVDPSTMLKNLSKPVLKSLSGRFIGRLKTFDDIIKFIDQKKNGFNVLLDSETKSLIKKLNSTLSTTVESFINNIILNLMYS